MRRPQVSKREQMLYIETARQKIAEVFFKYPDKEFSLTDLAKEAKVQKSNTGRILDELYKVGFIEITKLSKIWRIKANQRNRYYIRSKIVYNLNLVYQSGIVDFLVEHFKNPKVIVLFGSFRKGDDIAKSDIDIAIESDDVKDYEVIGLKNLADFENMIRRKIQIHLFNRKNIDISLFNNIANGFVLWGFLEVKP